MNSNSINHKNKLLDWTELVKDPVMQAARVAPYLTIDDIRTKFGDDVIEEFRELGMISSISTALIKQAVWYDTHDVDNGGPMVGKSIRHDDGNWYFIRSLGPRDHKGITHTCPMGKTHRFVISFFPEKRGRKQFKFYFDKDQQRTARNKIADLTIVPDITRCMESEDRSAYIALWTLCDHRSKLLPSKLATRDEIITALSSETFYSKFNDRIGHYLRLDDGDHRDSDIEYRAYVCRDTHAYETFKVI